MIYDVNIYVNYKDDLKVLLSCEFPYNENKVIILMNIILKCRESTCLNSLKYLGTLCICIMYKN